MNAREFLSLKPGTKLRVTLRSGREVIGQLLGNPAVATTGKPGLARVRFTILDIEHAERIDAASDRMGRLTKFRGQPFDGNKAKHEVNATQVIEVLS
jgi:hypothetical protein